MKLTVADIGPTLPEPLIELHSSLTTPDSEDWTLLVDGDTVHVTAYREVVYAGERCVMVGGGRRDDRRPKSLRPRPAARS